MLGGDMNAHIDNHTINGDINNIEYVPTRNIATLLDNIINKFDLKVANGFNA